MKKRKAHRNAMTVLDWRETASQTVNINRRWRATVLFISTRANVNLDTVGSHHHHHHHHPVGDGRHYQQKNKLAICTVEPIIW